MMTSTTLQGYSKKKIYRNRHDPPIHIAAVRQKTLAALYMKSEIQLFYLPFVLEVDGRKHVQIRNRVAVTIGRVGLKWRHAPYVFFYKLNCY